MLNISERRFEVSENLAGVKELCIFGEKLLHVELQTDYGKKEFVCGNEQEMLNHFLLKSFFENNEKIVRNSVYCSYVVEDGVIKATLNDKEKQEAQLWTLDTVEGTLLISGRDGFDDVKLSLGEITEKTTA